MTTPNPSLAATPTVEEALDLCACGCGNQATDTLMGDMPETDGLRGARVSYRCWDDSDASFDAFIARVRASWRKEEMGPNG